MMPKKIPEPIIKGGFNFHDPRQRSIYDYLKRLVSEGAASFYKDACRHMEADPPFETTTHIVSHLMREIESALRAVLEGIIEPIPSSGDKHKRQIEIILNALGIPQTDQIAIAWLNLPGENGLHGLAHRNNLEVARPLDDSFRLKWETLNSVLFSVLERFEAQYTKVFETLRELADKASPTQDDLDKLKLHIPNNRVAHEYFFGSISSPAWLPLLEASGYFKSPPGTTLDIESGGTHHPSWPVLVFLSKITDTYPDLVAKIISEIPDTANGNVIGALIDIATRMPKEQKLLLIPHVKRWMSSGGQFFSTTKSITFIETLGAEGEIDYALDLSRELLKFVPETTGADGGKLRRDYSRDVKTVMELWWYSQFLEKTFPPIAEQNPIKALALICSVLDKYYNLTKPIGESESERIDCSYIDRPSIAACKHPHNEGANDSLIDAILTVSSTAIENNSTLFGEIIFVLRKGKWPVFNRIALYLISKYPTHNLEITTESLANVSYIDNPNFEHEYALLADSGFHLLRPEQKESVFDFVEKAEPVKERCIKHSYSIADIEYFTKTWQRDKLSMFDSHLEGSIKDNYAKLVAAFGEANNPRVREPMGVFVGPVSVIDSGTLSQMSGGEVINLLKTWEPQKSKFGFGPSKEGLGRELDFVIKKEPSKYSALAMSFIDVDPTYVRNYIQAFPEIVRNQVSIDWASLIDLCLWVIHQPQKIAGRIVEDTFDEDVDWSGTRQAIIRLIKTGLNSNAIKFEFADKIWDIIEVLSDDPNPTPEEELVRKETLADDAYSLSINSIRGEAISATVEYGLWYTRASKKLPKNKRPELKGFALFPNVAHILEKHLTDPSLAVRAVYGYYLPWIVYLDRHWAIAHINDIFPANEFGTPLYNAAWKTYMCYIPVYNDTFEILHNQYSEAVRGMGTETKSKSHLRDRDSRLGEHLTAMFWRGKIDISNPDSLYVAFWRTANEEVRAHVLDYIGRSLMGLTEPLGNKEASLLKILWKMRIETAETAIDKKPYEKEMEAFVWWFTSGKFPEDWSTAEFLRSLNISKNVKADHFVIKRLIALVENKPYDTIKVLEKVLQKDKRQWVLLGSENELNTIFIKALESSEVSAQNAARELINRLVAWGYTNYRSLLAPQLLSN